MWMRLNGLVSISAFTWFATDNSLVEVPDRRACNKELQLAYTDFQYTLTMILLDTRKLARDISQLLRNATQYTRTGQIISEVLTETTREHVGKKYPNSTHWALDKIHVGPFMNDWGSVDVDVEGADRAYHQVVIRPNGKYLTIPIHREEVEVPAKDMPDLFKPKGKDILAEKAKGGSLTAVFALVKQVVQKQDPTLLPSDETYATAIGNRWVSEWFKTMDRENRYN